MLDFALIDDGHRFEAAVRMLADAARPLGRRKFRRAGVVEQQERAELRALRVIREQAPYGESVPDPMPLRTLVDGCDAFHRRSPAHGLISPT